MKTSCWLPATQPKQKRPEVYSELSSGGLLLTSELLQKLNTSGISSAASKALINQLKSSSHDQDHLRYVWRRQEPAPAGMDSWLRFARQYAANSRSIHLVL